MAESQQDQQATPAPEQSQPQAQPPAGPLGRKPLEDNDQQAMRAKQVREREKVERKNPFSPENKASRMAQAMKSLRQERGVPEPRRTEAPNDESREDTGAGDVPSGTAESAGQPSDGAAPAHKNVEASAESPNNEPPDWYKRQQDLQAAERRASQASAAADAKRAELEKAKADADAAVAKMAAAKDDPVEFLAQQGMTQEEWSQFLANGGKMTPEQRKLRDMAANLEKLQSQLNASEEARKRNEAQARFAAEDAQFAQSMQKFTFVPEMGGIGAVRERQRLLAQKTGQPVSLADAADHLEKDISTGLKRILQNTKIRSSLGLDVNTSNAGQAAEPPRTLSNRVSSESAQRAVEPHPLDWAAKKKLYMQRMERERAAQTGR